MEHALAIAHKMALAPKTGNACKHATATQHAMESVIAMESAMATKPRYASDNANKNAFQTATLTRSTAIATKTDVVDKRHSVNNPDNIFFF